MSGISPSPATWAPLPRELPGASTRSARLLNCPSARLNTRLEARTGQRGGGRGNGQHTHTHTHTTESKAAKLGTRRKDTGFNENVWIKCERFVLLRDERPLVPPKRERVAELPDTPGGHASITRDVPHTYMGVFLRVFRGSPQLVLTAMRDKHTHTHQHTGANGDENACNIDTGGVARNVFY